MTKKTRRRRTPKQKKILKKLIDYDLKLRDIAKYHGHTTSNASTHLLRENESYFNKAIKGIQSQSVSTSS